MIYVFSKLKPVEGAGVFWSGSVRVFTFDISLSWSANPEITAAALLLQVYGERYVDQMGVIGYFPSNYVNETHVFQEKTVEIPTTVSI